MRKSTKKLTSNWLPLCLVAALSACGTDSDQRTKDSPPDVPLVQTARQQNLGVNTKLGPRTNPEGEELPSDYHPFSKTNRVIAPLSEVYFAGLNYNGASQGLLDDEKRGFANLHSDSDESWTKVLFKAGKGDVDGDGFDEIIVAYYSPSEKAVKLKVIDREEGEHIERTRTVLSGIEINAKLPFLEIAVGDIDDDGRDEVALGLVRTLYLFDDAEMQYANMGAKTYPNGGNDETLSLLQLGFGDFNGNGRDQLLVSHSILAPLPVTGYSTYYRYSGSLDNQTDSQQIVYNVGVVSNVFPVVRFAIGDVDGDGLDEVVFSGSALNRPTLLFVMDDQRAGSAFLKTHIQLKSNSGVVTVLDVDMDGSKEIIAGNKIIAFKRRSRELVEKVTLPFQLPQVFATGDVNEDLKEDLIVYQAGAIQVWGNDATGNFTLRQALPATPVKGALPSLVAANVDDDSLVVRYTGKQELLFSKPQVLAAMAAPPYYADLEQNVDNSSTTFGQFKGTEAEKSMSFGFSVGWSVGFNQEFSLFGVKLFEMEAKATFETAMDWTATKSTSIETAYAFSSGPGEDKVVFTAVPYDVFTYEVVSAPDPDAVGEMIRVSIPRDPQTFSVARSFYNDNNGDAADVDESVLSHTIGDPWSYPTQSTRDELMGDGGWVNPTMLTVGQGSGTQSVTISASEGKGTGMAFDTSITMEVEVNAGGVTTGASAGTHFGLEAQVMVTEGFFVEGVIGDIAAESYSAENLYRAGIFAYPANASDGQNFIVVNYWVSE